MSQINEPLDLAQLWRAGQGGGTHCLTHKQDGRKRKPLIIQLVLGFSPRPYCAERPLSDCAIGRGWLRRPQKGEG